MKRIYLVFLILLLIVTGLGFILINNISEKEDYFNSVELSDNNLITNNTTPKFYDTILSVGLDEAGISGVNVVVSELSNAAKQQFDGGNLKAHLRFFNGTYYLFVDEYSRNDAIEIISHEIIHVTQYDKGFLVYENEELLWMGEKYELDKIDYDNRPWERDAFDKQIELSTKVYNKLYSRN